MPSVRRRPARRSSRLAATFVLALLLPLVVPLVAPVSVAGADNGNGGDDVGLCVATAFFPVGDLDTDPLDLDTDPEAFPLLSLPAGVGHLMFIVAGDSLRSECPVFDPDGGLEDDDFVPFDAFQAFLPGVSLPTDADDEIIPFVAEVDLLGPTFDPDSGVIAFEPISWASLWTEDGAPAVDGPETDLKLLNEGTTLEGPMELIVPPDENGVPVTAALFVPFVVSSELAWEDLGLDVRLIDLDDLDDQGEPAPFADWTVEDLTVRGDLCLAAFLVTGFDPDEPGRPSDDVGLGAATALEPGDDVVIQYGVIRDDVEGPGTSFCDVFAESLDSEEPAPVVRKVAAEHVPPTLDFAILSFLLLSRPGDDGEEEAPWIDLMATLDVVDLDGDGESLVIVDLDGSSDPDDAPDDADAFLFIETEPDPPGLWQTALRFTVQEDAAPGEYFIDLFMLAEPFEGGFGPDGTAPFAFILAGEGFLETEDLEDGFLAGVESDPLRLTIEVLGDGAEDGVVGEDGVEGEASVSGGDTGATSTPPAAPDVEGSLECSAPAIGSVTTCALVAEPGRTFTWEASTNPVFATGQVTTGADGTAAFAFTVPDELLGQPIVVQVLGVAGAAGTIGVASPPIPGSVPAGEGPQRTAGLLLLQGLLLLLGAAALGTRLSVTAPRRAVPARPR